MPIALDYTTRIDPAALVAEDVTDVCRYLSWLNLWAGRVHDTINPKIIQDAEFRELVDRGIGVTLNWEYDARDWMGGNATGLAHGTEAARQARELGYPAGCAIAGSADFDMTRAQWLAAGKGYAIGFTEAVREADYWPGVYGPFDVLTWCADEVPMSMYWQCMSTAYSQGRNSQPHPLAHLRQRSYKTVGGVIADYNDILRPSWGQHRKPIGPAAAALEQEVDAMIEKDVKPGFGIDHTGKRIKGAPVTVAAIDDVEGGTAKNGPAWAYAFIDPIDMADGDEAWFRVIGGDGATWGRDKLMKLGPGHCRDYLKLAPNHRGVSVIRVERFEGDPFGDYPASMGVNYGTPPGLA